VTASGAGGGAAGRSPWRGGGGTFEGWRPRLGGPSAARHAPPGRPPLPHEGVDAPRPSGGPAPPQPRAGGRGTRTERALGWPPGARGGGGGGWAARGRDRQVSRRVEAGARAARALGRPRRDAARAARPRARMAGASPTAGPLTGPPFWAASLAGGEGGAEGKGCVRAGARRHHSPPPAARPANCPPRMTYPSRCRVVVRLKPAAASGAECATAVGCPVRRRGGGGRASPPPPPPPPHNPPTPQTALTRPGRHPGGGPGRRRGREPGPFYFFFGPRAALSPARAPSPSFQFTFDAVLDGAASQADVFEARGRETGWRGAGREPKGGAACAPPSPPPSVTLPGRRARRRGRRPGRLQRHHHGVRPDGGREDAHDDG